MKVFIVTGEHPEVPGIRQTVHASLAGANEAAAELATIIADGMEPKAFANADNWREVVEACEDYFGAEYTYIVLTEAEVQP